MSSFINNFTQISVKLINIINDVNIFTLSVNTFSSLKNWLEYLLANTPINNNLACFQYIPLRIAISKKDTVIKTKKTS